MNDEVLDKTEPTFRYEVLTYDSPADKATYDKFQKLAATFKHSHTNWAKQGLRAVQVRLNSFIMMGLYK